MKLTPIKIKGKGGPKKTWRPPNPQHTTRKRRRDEAVGGNEGPRRNPPRQKRFKSKKPAAAIEELPTEILERIILLSRNLNFLRSSLRVGYRFSSRSFLTELLDAAFAPTWDVGYGHKLIMGKGEWEGLRLVPGDVDFQSAVLACPWLNMDLLFEAQAKWYRRTGGPKNSPLLPAEEGPDAAAAEVLVPARFEKDWDAFKEHCAGWHHDNWVASDSNHPHMTLPWMFEPEEALSVEVHPDARIPDRLLTGPYDWEATRMCFWLHRSGVRLEWQCTWAWELTGKGYQSILALDDAQLASYTLLLLAGLRVFEYWPHFLVDEKLAAARELEARGSSEEIRDIGKCARMVLHIYCENYLYGAS